MTTAETLITVGKALERVNDETKQMIYDLSCQLSELDIIRSFNQEALDMFTVVGAIIKKLGKESEYKIAGYKNIFDVAIKTNAKLPLDKFTLIILEFAPEIYEEQEDCFLNMSIPDKNVNVGNEFAIIRSEMFKNIWRHSNHEDRELIKQKVIPLTTYAHAFFYKSLTNISKKN